MMDWWRKYRSFFLGMALILVALLWYSLSVREKEHTNLFEKVLLSVSGPILDNIDSLMTNSADLWRKYLYLIDTVDENKKLMQENTTLRAALARLDEINLENQRLRRLLDFKEVQGIPTLPAQVIAEDASSWLRTIMLNKGERDGVKEGLPVVAAEGVVGRIVRVGPKHSRVLLITDASSALAALIQRNRARGVCRGAGDLLTFDFVLRQEEVVLGDRVVTSGMGGVFPKGLTVGLVEALEQKDFGLFQAVQVRPAVDFSHLEEVLVLIGEYE
ncbi:MAG: rod shape-determining protein MreC [Deltaproteobacteria bacterium]|jgi:rod shape-determining protein MreC|nr:rod shape-determining protein MreC [Deltaproteobacteria bacterium]